MPKIASVLMIARLIGFAGVLQSTVWAVDFCALRVTVTDPNGNLAPLVWVQLVDDQGGVVVDAKAINGRLDICDFGFGVHTLRIGPNECLPVTVSNLFLRLNKPIKVRAIINDCPAFDSGRNMCALYARVVDESGKGIRNAAVSYVSGASLGTTDGFGRVEVFVRPKSSVSLTFSAEGYRSFEVAIECKDIETIERTIVLTKK